MARRDGDALVRSLALPSFEKAVSETFLTDAEGRVLVRSAGGEAKLAAIAADGSMEVATTPLPSMADELRELVGAAH